MTETIGILGVGHLAGYLVKGFHRAEDPPEILLSPRNAGRARELSKLPGVAIAANNASVVEQASIVLLATRPAQSVEAIEALPWTEDHVLVSLCAGVDREQLAPHCVPAQVVRAMPITAAMLGESPTCLFPDAKIVRQLFDKVGIVLVLPDEETFDLACVSAAYYGWVHALIADLRDWASDAGLPPDLAGHLFAQTTRAAAAMVANEPTKSRVAFVEELATPGGITEAGLQVLSEQESDRDWRAACDAALAKLR